MCFFCVLSSDVMFDNTSLIGCFSGVLCFPFFVFTRANVCVTAVLDTLIVFLLHAWRWYVSMNNAATAMGDVGVRF